MSKKITVFLTTSPYSFENTLTAARLSEAHSTKDIQSISSLPVKASMVS